MSFRPLSSVPRAAARSFFACSQARAHSSPLRFASWKYVSKISHFRSSTCLSFPHPSFSVCHANSAAAIFPIFAFNSRFSPSMSVIVVFPASASCSVASACTFDSCNSDFSSAMSSSNFASVFSFFAFHVPFTCCSFSFASSSQRCCSCFTACSIRSSTSSFVNSLGSTSASNRPNSSCSFAYSTSRHRATSSASSSFSRSNFSTAFPCSQPSRSACSCSFISLSATSLLALASLADAAALRSWSRRERSSRISSL
mmetsp:Transcript_1366/g.3156  ORF Transcript_1366/g.3156 Transcript_1366/m.3156 type:complete len:256 (-) Transcript_1366:1224-1991(-)